LGDWYVTDAIGICIGIWDPIAWSGVRPDKVSVLLHRYIYKISAHTHTHAHTHKKAATWMLVASVVIFVSAWFVLEPDRAVRDARCLLVGVAFSPVAV